MTHLLLWLEAPLQSWGSASRFSRRQTEAFPTLSGVMGMICCARGVNDGQEGWLSAWSPDGMHVDAYPPRKATTDLVDFHMVGGGYDDGDPWQCLMIPKTVDGKRAVGGGTKLTSRVYLQDAAFAVVLLATEKQADEVERALANPVWPIYLGRKCCAPTDVVFRGRFSTLDDARQAATTIALSKNRKRGFHVRPASPGEQGGFLLSDVPLRLGQQKEYGQREVVVEPIAE